MAISKNGWSKSGFYAIIVSGVLAFYSFRQRKETGVYVSYTDTSF